MIIDIGYDNYWWHGIFNKSSSFIDSLLKKRNRGKMRKKQMGQSKEDLCRDFMIEMILGSMIASVASTHSRHGGVCKRAATYDSPSNEKIDRTVSIELSLQTPKNPQNTSCNEDSRLLANSSNMIKPCEENECNEGWFKGANLGGGAASLFKYSTWNCRSRRRRHRRHHRHRRCRPRMVLLKPKIRRRPRLALAFKADLMTREIFRLDPIFHESCLLNVCFCLNAVNRKLFNKSTSLELRLIFDIRRNDVNFKLTGRRSHETRSCLIFNNHRVRVPMHERDDKDIISKTNRSSPKILLDERRKQSLVEHISDHLSSRCLSGRAGKRLEEILFDCTTSEERSCLSFNDTPIAQSSRINMDSSIFQKKNCSSSNISKNKDQILNSTKEVRKGQQISEVSNIIKDVCSESYCNIETEKIIRVVGNEENDNIMDNSLTIKKIFSKDELNFDCDSKCSCCSKVSSLFSAGRENQEDAASNVNLINEEKLEEAQNASIIASAMMGVSLLDISEKKDYQVPCPMSRKNNGRANSTSIIVPTVNIAVQISRSKKELKKEKFPNDESSRKMKIEIFSKEESKRLLLTNDCEKRFHEGKYKNPCSRVCTCDTWTCSYNRMHENLSSRIQNNVSSNSILKSFCESFYLSGIRSIRRLKNVVRLNLRRFMRRGNQRETIDKRLSNEKNFIYIKREYNEEKKGRANDFNGPIRHDHYFPYDLCNRCSKQCKNNNLSISARGSIKRSKSPSRCFFQMKSNYGEDLRRKSKEFKRTMVDLSSTIRNDDKFINDLGIDFRTKLEQYVALCKNIKYSLMGNSERRDVGRLL
ncbi:PREDICTED: uncharacterized protein LOC106791241 isoform X2 [Polistes canadensis]|uniref:uncharacterized protein LOC106791241 isoform X2 n=1 Tax=Polistes canadensis TaxID=91411 RepID=UPI000719038F|nr:PREDICTED: uncharacterized protein LOC106791241 isoform X2 [Polistes canadensis]XP_014612232.1 PREDICTED: uncharacterized protein LOC106791241 isoform X2 [Polistes canadensis]